MERKRSKYEQAWRTRVGHDARPVQPTPPVSPIESPAEPVSAIPSTSEPVHAPPVVPAPVEQPVSPMEHAAPSPTTPATPQLTALTFKDSSNIRAATLDLATGIVAVDFANGTTYRYGRFTTELMEAWQSAKSAGGWFHANVKNQPGRHPIVPSGK